MVSSLLLSTALEWWGAATPISLPPWKKYIIKIYHHIIYGQSAIVGGSHPHQLPTLQIYLYVICYNAFYIIISDNIVIMW